MFLNIEFKGISLVNFWVGESDGYAIMGDNVWDFVGTNCFSFNFQKFEFGFSVFNRNQGESSLSIIQHSVIFVSFSDWQDVHDTNWESSISSNFTINSESSVFVHNGKGNLTSGKGEIESLSELV